MRLWLRYWSAPGGRISAGVVRIALALSTWIMLARIADSPAITAPGDVAAGAYHPIGVLMVFRAPPPAFVIELAWIAAHVGALALLLGLFTRVACAVTAAAALIVASQAMSYQPAWSHDLNVVLLALLAFLGARGGDALSLDAVIARRRGRAIPPAAYQWSLRLIQLAVGLMFVSACMLKLKTGGLHWALSDNLRHQLLVRYDLIGETTHSPMVDWLLASAWHYETTALCNMISQLTPLLAIIFVHRPWIRAIAGVCFILEVAGLYVVMQLGNPSWFALAAVFFDWDRIWAFVRHRDHEPAPPAVAPPRAAAWYVALFVTYDLVILFAPGLDQRIRSFPFSRFPMFSSVRAKQPYGEHQTYEVVGGRVELIADRPVPPDIQAAIDRDYVYRSLPSELHADVLRTRCEVALASMRQRYPQLAIHGVRVLATAFQAPAYPAPAVLTRRDLGVIGELREATWVSYDHVVAAGATRFAPVPAGAPLAVYRDGLPIAAPAVGADGQISLPGGTAAIDVTATLPGADGAPRPFVIARRIGRNDRG